MDLPGPSAPEDGAVRRGPVLHAFLALELVLALLGIAGVLIELVATPAAERCTGPGTATFSYVSVTSALGAVPLGLLVLLGLAAVWVRTEQRVRWIAAEMVLTASATVIGGLSFLGWIGVCSGHGPFGG